MAVGDTLHWLCDTLATKVGTNIANKGRSVGIVRSRTKATELAPHYYKFPLKSARSPVPRVPPLRHTSLLHSA
jgi:hypothetical protein